MALTINVLHPVFAGEVSGVDLTRPISRETPPRSTTGMDRYGVLVFHDQDITDEQQIAFSRNFGALESQGAARQYPQGVGEPAGRRDQRSLQPRQGRQGHLGRRSPVVLQAGRPAVALRQLLCEVPAKYSLLSARVIPSWGGNTEFADMRAAYDALDERTKAEVEDLVCEHSLLHSRAAIGFTDFTPEEIATSARCGSDWCASIRRPAASRCSVVPCRRDRGLDDPGGALVPARPDRARDAARVRLFARLAAVRSGDLGQPRDDAPRAPLRTQRGARHAPHDAGRRSTDCRQTRRAGARLGRRERFSPACLQKTRPVPSGRLGICR